MQTPPPTSISAGRRRKVQPKPLTPSGSLTGLPRRMSSIGAHDHPFQFSTDVTNSSPLQQLSPDNMDLFGYPLTAPLTAPLSSQHKLFWETDTSMHGMDFDFTGGDLAPSGGLGMGTNHNFDWTPGRPPLVVGDVAPSHVTPPHRDIFPHSHGSTDAAMATSGADTRSSVTGIAGMASTQSMDGAVNPSLLFAFSSSPVNSTSLLPGSTDSQGLHMERSREPYEHQQADLRRERDAEILHRPTFNAGPTGPTGVSGVHSGATSQPGRRPSLKRSATDVALHQRAGDLAGHAPVSFPSCSSQMDPLAFASKRQSLKKSRIDPPHALPSRSSASKRTSVTFSIDSSGRAKTETTILSPESRREDERDKGWDDGDSDSSAATDLEMVTSRNVSFNFADENLPRPKLAHFATDGVRAREPRPSLSKTRPLSGSGGRAFGQMDRSSHTPRSFLGDEAESEAETTIDGHDVQGDAQHALREMLERRGRAKKPAYLVTSAARPSHSLPGRGSFSTITSQHRPYSGQVDPSTISPTTITDPDLATPSTDRDSQASESTRCVCNAPDSGGYLMIQCDSCTKWLHVKCVGLSSTALPPVYVCIYCTGQTPNVRGGRIREPTVRMGVSTTGLTSSPLAHKSQHFHH
ncbi:MAG: hypothetical protein M1838_004823 [Thelocarpon superellum]|nr:MAG: hypothetical protein M1838_004823 [Thelocarpon superellum]